MNCEFNVFFPDSEEEELVHAGLHLRKDKKRKEAESAKRSPADGRRSEDKVAKNQGDAYIEVFKKLRPGEP